MFLASVLMVGFYFERNRGVAATIAMCGSSMGMALLAPLTRCLFIEFNNLNNTVTLITGIVIQGFVLGECYDQLLLTAYRSLLTYQRKISSWQLVKIIGIYSNCKPDAVCLTATLGDTQ